MSDRPTTNKESHRAGRLRVRIVEGPDPVELRCDDGVPLEDPDHRIGTFTDREGVSEAVVPIGTQIRIGRTVLALLDAATDSEPAPATDASTVPPYRVARAEALSSFERSYLRRLIETTGGNASAAARAANMDRPYLLSLLRRHGLR